MIDVSKPYAEWRDNYGPDSFGYRKVVASQRYARYREGRMYRYHRFRVTEGVPPGCVAELRVCTYASPAARELFGKRSVRRRLS